jgi:hypothetical protein
VVLPRTPKQPASKVINVSIHIHTNIFIHINVQVYIGSINNKYDLDVFVKVVVNVELKRSPSFVDGVYPTFIAPTSSTITNNSDRSSSGHGSH